MKEECTAVSETASADKMEATTFSAEGKKKPSRLRKWVVRGVVAGVAFLALIFFSAAFFLGEIVQLAVNQFGAGTLGVDKCRIESLKIYPLCGVVILKKFEIGKPIVEGEPFEDDLLSLEFLYIDFDMLSLFSQKKVIDNLILRNLTLAYEKPVTGDSNVDALVKKLAANASPDGVPVENVDAERRKNLVDIINKLNPTTEKTPEPEQKISETDFDTADGNAQEKPMYLGARLIDVSGIKTKVSYGLMPIAIPQISFKFEEGLGMDEDLTSTDFGVRIAQRVMNVLHGADFGVVGDAANATVDVVTDAAGTATDAVTGAAGMATDAVTGAAGTLIDGVVNIFNESNDDKKTEEK